MNFSSPRKLKPQEKKNKARKMTKYDPEIWKSTSSCRRTICRLPVGMTGMDALRWYAPDEYHSLRRRIELEAANLYRRLYAREEDQVHLTKEEWRAFMLPHNKPSTLRRILSSLGVRHGRGL